MLQNGPRIFLCIARIKTKNYRHYRGRCYGRQCCAEIGFKCELLESPDLPEITELFQTSADLTKFAAQQMKDSGVAMILFVGGRWNRTQYF